MNSQPKCVITGCDLTCSVWGTVYHGDLHEIGDTYIFNAVLFQGEALALNREVEDRHISLDLDGGDYFERRGVFIFHKSVCELSTAAKEYIHA